MTANNCTPGYYLHYMNTLPGYVHMNMPLNYLDVTLELTPQNSCSSINKELSVSSW